MIMETETKKKADLKVVMLGAANTGKTTFIYRYIEGQFKETISTIGASFSLKQWKQFNIAIWDTAGGEKYAGLSNFYTRGAGAVIMTFDLTNSETFDSLRNRFVPLLQSALDNCLVVVVGTKADLLTSQSRAVQTKDAQHLADELNTNKLSSLAYFETSSVTGDNVTEVFEFIFTNCLSDKSSGPSHSITNDSISLTDQRKHVTKSNQSSSCC